ncbi:hypothetical protein LCEOLIKB_00516 [Aeromonas hydrophila]
MEIVGDALQQGLQTRHCQLVLTGPRQASAEVAQHLVIAGFGLVGHLQHLRCGSRVVAQEEVIGKLQLQGYRLGRAAVEPGQQLLDGNLALTRQPAIVGSGIPSCRHLAHRMALPLCLPETNAPPGGGASSSLRYQVN